MSQEDVDFSSKNFLCKALPYIIQKKNFIKHIYKKNFKQYETSF